MEQPHGRHFHIKPFEKKAECIADSIELQCSHTLPPYDTQHISLIEEEVRQKPPQSPWTKFKTRQGLKAEKAPGLDGISNKAVKCFPLTLYHFWLQYSTRALRIVTSLRLKGSQGVQLALFADDTALYLCGQTELNICPHLQKAIKELARWLQTWRIEVNDEKSAAISFIYRKGRSPVAVAHGTPPLRINNAPIPWQHTYKYLGITFDRNLHFRDHIKRVRKTAISYQSRLKGMLGRNSKLTLRNKRTLYLMCIRTVLTYASPVFAHAAPKRLKELQVLQNKFCRTATKAHWCVKNSVLHRDLDLPSIRKYMRDASERFFAIAESHPNPLLSAAVAYEAPPPYHFIRRPRNITDPPDDFTAEVERLRELNKQNDN
ncbi:RNA-directed DNA polymerase from mobile element jockey [Eumeta japonica]|uniref:RNA-directed DNA polymerase from mobile element jockey n=1 Tax=Eumeta variegata TaxID=151549 RepID=A0A4C1V5S4_EUMVA|nr:RNA-directed DNA polymerase from mobile element jockey [Eumeta japonica]